MNKRTQLKGHLYLTPLQLYLFISTSQCFMHKEFKDLFLWQRSSSLQDYSLSPLSFFKVEFGDPFMHTLYFFSLLFYRNIYKLLYKFNICTFVLANSAFYLALRKNNSTFYLAIDNVILPHMTLLFCRLKKMTVLGRAQAQSIRNLT